MFLVVFDNAAASNVTGHRVQLFSCDSGPKICRLNVNNSETECFSPFLLLHLYFLALFLINAREIVNILSNLY